MSSGTKLARVIEPPNCTGETLIKDSANEEARQTPAYAISDVVYFLLKMQISTSATISAAIAPSDTQVTTSVTVSETARRGK